MDQLKEHVQGVCDYLQAHGLMLTTAESCTAGCIVALLSQIPGSGCVLESGYVVYSPEAKQRLLKVSADTIARFGLTSEAVAREMALGALRNSQANSAVATTGVAGPEPMDGIPPGTVCLAWVFAEGGEQAVFTRTVRFYGEREEVMQQAAVHALSGIEYFHQRYQEGERA